MGDNWMTLLFLVSLFVAFGRIAPQPSGTKATNVTVKPSTDSLEVSWKAPTYNPKELESYRVRIYAEGNDDKKRVYWVSPKDLSETVGCLEAGTSYVVQVYTRYFKSSNITDVSSESVTESTLVDRPPTEPGFLSQVWEQRIFVLVGAILMLILLLFFTPCICFCYARKRKSLSLNRERDRRKTSKETSLPSATELQARNKYIEDNENCYSVDPVQSLGTRTNPSYDSSASRSSPMTHTLPHGGVSTNHRAANTHTPPPSYGTYPRSSFPYEQAPDRPPAALPHADGYESDPDADAYQNDVFLPPPGQQDMEVYSNQMYFPRPEEPAEIYGNIHY